MTCSWLKLFMAAINEIATTLKPKNIFFIKSLPLCQKSPPSTAPLTAYFRGFQHLRIHNIDGCAGRVSDDLVEYVGELGFVLLASDISDVRRADDILHCEQRIIGVEHRL